MILLPKHRQALLSYIDNYPNCWKSKIREEWDNPFCIPSLRALRNTKGPSWLNRITAQQVRDAITREH